MRPIDRDSLPHLVATALDLARTGRDTALTRLLAAWWGVELGPGCSFRGVPHLRRMPRSTIRLGARCELRSAPWANQVGLDRPCMISTLREGAVVEIGDGAGLSGAVIGAAARVVLGRDVLVGANCTITDTDWHPVERARRLDGTPGAVAPVHIEDGVWLSMAVTVLKGVTIGAGTVVAAGSVVTRSLPAGVLAGGAPARVLKELA